MNNFMESDNTSYKLIFIAFAANTFTWFTDNYDAVFKLLSILAVTLTVILNFTKLIGGIINYFKNKKNKNEQI